MGRSLSSAVSNYFDIEIKQAQLDNLKTDNTVKYEEAKLKEAQRKMMSFNYDFESALYDTSADYRKEQLRKMKADTAFQLDENQRRTAMNSSNLKEATYRIKKMEADTAKSKAENNLV